MTFIYFLFILLGIEMNRFQIEMFCNNIAFRNFQTLMLSKFRVHNLADLCYDNRKTFSFAHIRVNKSRKRRRRRTVQINK